MPVIVIKPSVVWFDGGGLYNLLFLTLLSTTYFLNGRFPFLFLSSMALLLDYYYFVFRNVFFPQRMVDIRKMYTVNVFF